MTKAWQSIPRAYRLKLGYKTEKTDGRKDEWEGRPRDDEEGER